MSPVVDIVDVTNGDHTGGDTQDPDNLIHQCLSQVFHAVDQSPEMFMRCCLEYVEGKTRLLSQRGCEQNMVRLMEAVRLGSGSDVEDLDGTLNAEEDQCETADLVGEHRNARDVSSSEEEQQPVLGPGNGAVHANYSWTQTLSEVSVVVPVPLDLVPIKGKDCRVLIKKNSLSIAVAGRDEILGGLLYAPVRVDDCVWNLVDSNTLEVSLTKVDSMKWWPCVVQGEPEIDTSKIEPEPSSLHDVDPEMRSTVEKMMFDQQQQAIRQQSPSKQKAESVEDKQEAIRRFMEAHPELDFSDAVVDMS